MVASDDHFRSGGGLLPGETSQSDVHVEKRVVDWFSDKGLLKKGYTLVIQVNKEGVMPCESGKGGSTGCNRFLQKTAQLFKVRVIYQAGPGHEATFGDQHSSAKLEKPAVPPKREFVGKAPPAGKGAAPTAGGSGAVPPASGRVSGAMPKVGVGLGILGFGADLWFYHRYGPCAFDYTGTMPGCNGMPPPGQPRDWKAYPHGSLPTDA